MQFVDFVGAMSSPINIEISPKSAAATMGGTNCANNLTFYAISANIIGATTWTIFQQDGPNHLALC